MNCYAINENKVMNAETPSQAKNAITNALLSVVSIHHSTDKNDKSVIGMRFQFTDDVFADKYMDVFAHALDTALPKTLVLGWFNIIPPTRKQGLKELFLTFNLTKEEFLSFLKDDLKEEVVGWRQVSFHPSSVGTETS